MQKFGRNRKRGTRWAFTFWNLKPCAITLLLNRCNHNCKSWNGVGLMDADGTRITIFIYFSMQGCPFGIREWLIQNTRNQTASPSPPQTLHQELRDSPSLQDISSCTCCNKCSPGSDHEIRGITEAESSRVNSACKDSSSFLRPSNCGQYGKTSHDPSLLVFGRDVQGLVPCRWH